MNIFLNSNNVTPISVLFAIIKTFKKNQSLNANQFILNLQTINSTSTALNSILSFNLIGEQPIPLAHSLINQPEDEKALISLYIYEFERAFMTITDENRAQHFVTLSLFIERKTDQIDEWLFTFQG